MPARGGGQRTPTAVVFPPGKAVVRHVKNAVLHAGRRSLVQGCGPGERLVDAWHAVAFERLTPPDGSLARVVTVSQSLAPARTTALVRTARVPFGTRALLQVAAVCAGGK
jgi:hypothetical protein